MKLTLEQQRVLVSIVEGAGTTQRFGRWARPTYDALKRRGLITTTKLDAPDNCYALWRVDLTEKGRSERAALMGKVEPFPFPDHPIRTLGDTCWHDPHYPAGEWRCLLKKNHADFHRYVPVGLITLDRASCTPARARRVRASRANNPVARSGAAELQSSACTTTKRESPCR